MARTYTKRNQDYWKKDTAYGEYVKEFKRLEKEVRRGAGVKRGTTWKQGLFVPGERFNFEVRAPMMNRSGFQRYVAKTGMSAIQAAQSGFNLLSDELVDTIRDQLDEAGIKTFVDASGHEVEITDIMIKTRQLPQEVWDKMEAYADENGLEMSFFFGS